MKTLSLSLNIDRHIENAAARAFCEEFLHGSKQRYIFGRNEYAKSIAQAVEVDGFIDDFTSEQEFLGKPVLRVEDIPSNALVVSVVIGRPFTAENRLKSSCIHFLDYFAFKRYINNTRIAPVKFWDEFQIDFESHRDRYDWIYGLLQDAESRQTLSNIINFRLSSNLDYMRGYTDTQYRQYFEDFLALKSEGEIFVDVGCFDGYTSNYFIKQCSGYAAVHVFEPEPKNMVVVKEKLAGHPRIHFHPHGLSNQSQILRFNSQGSSSRISEQGDMEIKVERLDDVLHEPFTFLKMDIEGAEMPAIEGAQQAITKYHPRLAISIYHRYDDLWKIPERVLSYRDDYEIFLRHYTEGVDETVMFFIPKK